MFPLHDTTNNHRASNRTSQRATSLGSTTKPLSTSPTSSCAAARALRWTKTLALPQNVDSFQTLYSRRMDERLLDSAMKDIELDMLDSARDKRAVRRLYSTLTTMEPALGALPFVPYLSAAVTRAIPSSPLVAHEVAVHLLLNVLQDWCTQAPHPPTVLLNWIDDFFKSLEEDRVAHKHFLDIRGRLASVPTSPHSLAQQQHHSHRKSEHSPTNSSEKRAFLDDDDEPNERRTPNQQRPVGGKMSAAGQRLASRQHEAMLRENEGLAKELAKARIRQKHLETGMSRKGSSEDSASSQNELPSVTVAGEDESVSSLWEHLNFGCGATVLDYIWLPLQTFFLYSIPSSAGSGGNKSHQEAHPRHRNNEWLELLEGFIIPSRTPTYTSPMEFFARSPTNQDLAALTAESIQNLISLSIAVVASCRGRLMRCSSRTEVQTVLTTAANSLPPGAISRKYAFVSSALRKSLTEGRPFCVSGPLWRVPLFIPPKQPYYPLLRIGEHAKIMNVTEAVDRHNRILSNPLLAPHEAVPSTYQKHAARSKDLSTIQGEETEIYRQLKNELDALSASCNIAEFHGFTTSPTGTAGRATNTAGNVCMEGAPLHQRRRGEGIAAPVNSKMPPSIDREGHRTPARAETHSPILHAPEGDDTNPQTSSTDASVGLSAVTTIAKAKHARFAPAMSDASTTTAGTASTIPDDIIEAASLLVRASAGGRLLFHPRGIAAFQEGESIDRDTNSPSMGDYVQREDKERMTPSPVQEIIVSGPVRPTAMPPLHPHTTSVVVHDVPTSTADPRASLPPTGGSSNRDYCRTTVSAHESSIGPSTSADGGRTDGASRSSHHPSIKLP